MDPTTTTIHREGDTPLADNPLFLPRPGDPRLTRRRFLGRSGLALGGFALAPALLAACGDGDTSAATPTPTPGTGACGPSGAAQAADGKLKFANWPLYIDDETVDLFATSSGLDFTYTEEINDNISYFAKIQPELNSGKVIDADVIAPTFWMAARLIDLCWVEPLPLDQIPNAANLVPDLQKPSWDPTGAYSLPWQSGVAGIAYNIAKTGRELKSMDDLLDPAFKGRIGMLTEMRDTVGLWMMYTGKTLANATFDDAAEAFEIIEKAANDGQIRAFTGNDYQDDLIDGNFWANVAWSGDVAQLALDNPDLRFVVPESGSTLWSDVMVIPRNCRHIDEAAQWMNYVYDPVNAARIAAYVGYMPPVQGVRDELRKSDDPAIAALADSDLMFPTTLSNTQSWGPLSDEQEALFDERFAEIQGL